MCVLMCVDSCCQCCLYKQLGCNAVTWAPAVNPGSLVEVSGQCIALYVYYWSSPKGGPKAPVTATKRLASGGGDHMVRVWR